MQNDYAIALPELDDDQILATDEAGEELIHFAVSWSGKTVRIHYPRFGQWERYQRSVGRILTHIGGSLGKIDIDNAQIDHGLWQELVGRFLFLKDVGAEIKQTFFACLRPTVDGLDEKQSRAWLTKNAPLDGVVRMFCALLTPQSQLKKNARFALTKIFQVSTDQLCTATSTKSTDGPRNESIDQQQSLFGSFC